jgi:hypothetical protein
VISNRIDRWGGGKAPFIIPDIAAGERHRARLERLGPASMTNAELLELLFHAPT